MAAVALSDKVFEKQWQTRDLRFGAAFANP
jgi:hypothetical protein